jgi:hypothetical protein
MSTYDLMTELSNLTLDRSKKYTDGTFNYSFAFGWFTYDMGVTLEEMGLTKKQLKVLEDRINKLKRLAEEDK